MAINESIEIQTKKERVPTASKKYNVSESTLWRWISEGKIQVTRPSARITLIDTAELESFLNGNNAE